MHTQSIHSWGNVAHGEHVLMAPRSRFDLFPPREMIDTVLPFGLGRSYGDTCLNVGGGLLMARALDRFISFDRERGTIECESGVLLSEILELVTPHGWFLPVVPGTQHVTVGGAIASDVHGKNHFQTGTFGRHVCELELLRSSGETIRCSPTQNADWFAATCGGLGLTGLIRWAKLRLKPVPGPAIAVESIRFARLDDFFELTAESNERFEHTLAWIDCLARGKHLGRGIFQRANHCGVGTGSVHPPRPLVMPFAVPFSLVNSASLRLFNAFLFHRCGSAPRRKVMHYESFLFPLDRIRHWNRLYGPRGFHQYQCAVPLEGARDTVRALLETISGARMGSFLAVLKQFGAARSPGLLSFPIEGVTLALDFPSGGDRTTRLFEQLDDIVSQAHGRLYPAKDCRMPASLFQSGYPRWREFAAFQDPRCRSTFWQRVTREPS